MDVASSAVGVASLGIQVCQGLLSFYDGWKSFSSDISSTYDLVDDLSRTLALLKSILDSDELDEEKKERVKRCVHLCEESLVKLSQKSQKLRKYEQPEGLRQKAWAELQRGWYPFRASTLAKLREIVADVRDRLKLAVQVLHLDVSTDSQRILKSVATNTSDLVDRSVAIQTSVTHISAQTQHILTLQQSDQFKKIKAWLSPPDPWTNHIAARQRHEPYTGTWLLQSDQYQKWKAGDIHHLWMFGKAGCGKTVLCSTVIEDVREYCDGSSNAMYAAFYFSFSDNQKQLYEDLLRSLVAQLSWKEPGLSILTQACAKPNANHAIVDELENIMLACIQPYDELFLLLDAIDECPEGNEVRQNVLEGLERVTQKAGNIRMFITSREVTDVGDYMQTLGARFTPVAARSVDADIQRYTWNQLSRDRKLSRLDATTKNMIGDTISQRADGM
jgi:ankyrin repeat domain-containing protein 50